MTKKLAIIASVLKPINDVRMYEKFATTLSDSHKFDVWVVGFPSPVPVNEKTSFIPLPFFRRLSLKRLGIPWKIYRIYVKLKPEIIIVNTHELLLVTWLYKILFGAKILYDIQENYFRNILFQNNFPPVVKHSIALAVRLKEVALTPFYDHLILAEEKYSEELRFLGRRFTIILNKYKPLVQILPSLKEENGGAWRFLISGTIAEVYGIWDGINFFQKVAEHLECTLSVVGHCPDSQTATRLKLIAKDLNNIILKISPTPISHERILQEYNRCDFALAPYHKNKSIDNCIPVKFYEYAAFRVPILIPDHNLYWINFLAKYEAALPIDFNSPVIPEIIATLKSFRFYSSSNYEELLWQEEATALLNILD